MLELTTLANVKTMLKNPDSALDALINSLIKAFSRAAVEFCLRDFELDTQTEYFDGGTSVLFLTRKPVVSITGIWVDDDWVWGAEDLIPVTDYRLVNADTGIVQYKYGLWYPDSFPKGSIKVTYEGGYETVPDDLEMAARTQVAYRIKRREDVGLTAVSFPDGTVSKRSIGEFLPEVKSVLDRYTPNYVG